MRRLAISLTLAAVTCTVLAVPTSGNAVLNFVAGCGVNPTTAVGTPGANSTEIQRACTFKVPGKTDGAIPVIAGVFGSAEARQPLCFGGLCFNFQSSKWVTVIVYLRRASTGNILNSCLGSFQGVVTCLKPKPLNLYPGETLRCEVIGQTGAPEIRIAGACFM